MLWKGGGSLIATKHSAVSKRFGVMLAYNNFTYTQSHVSAIARKKKKEVHL